jgi:[acyl-carrier-protein] S-malonyltransferase
MRGGEDMTKTAFVFPGQGAQTVGMGKALAEKFPEVKAVFETADEALGFSISELCFEGPADQLTRTENTQPAILTMSVAVYQLVKQLGLQPIFTAGHSLGEYSALVASGSLSFQDAVRLVRQRGMFMEEAVPTGKGAMAAVMGLERDALADVCQTISGQGRTVELANLNSPGQIVISGTKEGVEQAGQLAKEKGARRVIPLQVSGPFHSSLMRPAAERLAEPLAEVKINAAVPPVVCNFSARPVEKPDEIKHALLSQVSSPVLWEDAIRWMIEQGVDTFVEIGPGNVLSGLIKKIDRRVTTLAVGDQEGYEQLKQTLA